MKRPLLTLAHRRDPQIVIAPEPFGAGYDVTVTPPQPIGHDREFPTHHAALAYANQLGQAAGWAVIDRCQHEDIAPGVAG